MSRAAGADRISRMREEEARRKEKRKEKFTKDMRDFPCMFNLGCCNIDTEFKEHDDENLTLPDVSQNKWRELKETVLTYEEDELAPHVWKENLMTRVYVEFNNLSEASEMNRQIFQKHENNLVAIANSAFLLFFKNQFAEADKVLKRLKTERAENDATFCDMKYKAIGEQGYAYCAFGGATNYLSSIELLSVSCVSNTQRGYLHVPDEQSANINKRLEFLLAMVYRRCTHLQIYTENPDKINVHKFALKAAEMLWGLGGNVARSKCIRGPSLIELAFLRHGDEKYLKTRTGKEVLKASEWSSIVGHRDCETLRDMALEVQKECPTSKVLKIAGQLYRYSGDFVTAEKLLTQSIDIRPSNRAHHHLGLLYRTKAINFERNNHPFSPGNLKFPRKPVDLRRDLSSMKTLPTSVVVEKKEGFDINFRLLTLVRFPGRGLKPFSEDNPFTDQAIRHLEESVKISHHENRSAFYDLLVILLQCGRYEDFKAKCQTLIDESCTADKNYYPVYLANAFNLYGVFYSIEAQKSDNEATRKDLTESSDYYLHQAARLSSQLQEDVPELSSFTTEVWSAHALLTRKYSQTEDQERNLSKLFELCSLVKDYTPYLHVLDNLLTNEGDSWNNVEALTYGLQCYWELGDSEGARKLLQLISEHAVSTYQLMLRENETAREIMLASGRSTSSSKNSSVSMAALCHPTDQNEWKEVFTSFYSQSILEAELVSQPSAIVDDSGHHHVIVSMDDEEIGCGTPSVKVSGALVKILKKNCGLKVNLAHKVGYEGGDHLPQELEAIRNSNVVIFVVDADEGKEFANESDMKTVVKITVDRHDGELSEPLTSGNLRDGRRELENVDDAAQEHRGGQSKPELISSIFDFVINSTIASHLKDKKPDNIVVVTMGSQLAIPSVLSNSLKLALSDEDIQALCRSTSGEIDDLSGEMLTKLFKAMCSRHQCD